MKTVLTVTGGGSGIFDTLLTKGGASSWFLEGNIPYTSEATDAFLGYKPDKYCSDRTARRLAVKSYQRAIGYGVKPEEAQGIACTATLRKQEERAGRRHFFHIALHSLLKTQSWECEFYPDFDRQEQERLVSYALQSVVTGEELLLKYRPFDVVEKKETDVYGYKQVLNYEVPYTLITGDIFGLDKEPIIYSGSFNPMHKGHIDIINWCNKYLKHKPYIEISAINPDKGTLDYIDINPRIRDISNSVGNSIAGIIISKLPYFQLKIWTYKSPQFLVGTDTFNRVFNPKYYNENDRKLHAIAEDIRIYNSFFHILDRKDYSVDNSVIAEFGLQNHVRLVPKSEYEDSEGLASSKIRNKE